MDTDLQPQKNTIKNTKLPRLDLLFSYWILAWFLIFYFIPDDSRKGTLGFIKQYLNPAVAFYLALAHNIIVIFLFWIYAVNWNIIVQFIAIISIIKIYPLYLLKNYRVDWKNNLLACIGLFALYNVYLYWNGTEFFQVYHKYFNSCFDETEQSSVFDWVYEMFEFLTN